jgi:hypothetical protein
MVKPKEVDNDINDGDSMDLILPQMLETFYKCRVSLKEFVERIP